MNDWYEKLAKLEQAIEEEGALQWIALIGMTLTFAVMLILLV